MPAVLDPDVRAALSLADDLESAATAGELCRLAVARLHEFVRADYVWCDEVDTLGRRLVATVTHPVDALDSATAHRIERHMGEHPTLRHHQRTGGEAAAFSDLFTERAFHNLSVYTDYYGPLGVEDQLAIRLSVPGSTVIGMGFNRGRRGFSEEEHEVLDRLRPYLASAYCRVRERERAERVAAAMHSALEASGREIVILDESGRVEHATDTASAWLDECCPADRGRTDWVDELRRDRASLPERRLSLAGGGSLSVMLVRGAPDVLVLEARSAVPSPAGLTALGLTPREAEVLAHVAVGRRNREIATELSISELTVRKHVEHIYEKLDVRTRAGATARAFEAVDARRIR